MCTCEGEDRRIVNPPLTAKVAGSGEGAVFVALAGAAGNSASSNRGRSSVDRLGDTAPVRSAEAVDDRLGVHDEVVGVLVVVPEEEDVLERQ